MTDFNRGLVFFLQESHALGKKPKNPEDMIEEGELILSVNILYPVIFNKVSSEAWFCLSIRGRT